MINRPPLEYAVDLVNANAEKPVVSVVICDICQHKFVTQVQNIGRKGFAMLCPSRECKNEARRRRQRKGG